MAEKKYIELQKALNVCEMHYQHCLIMHDWSGDATADNIMRDIETIPTAEVEEVKHGEWILHPDGSATCNQCKTHQLYIWDMDRSQNFCGHCGAKMDGGNAE